MQLLVTRLTEQLHLTSSTETARSPGKESDNAPKNAASERLQTLQEGKNERENLRLNVEHLDFRNDENKTPLHLAAKNGNVE